MKFDIQKTKIEVAITKAARIAGKHLTLPVLSCVYLEASGEDLLTIKSTNLDVGIEIELKAKVLESGTTAVPAGVLLGLISSIKEENLQFETVDNNIKITSGKNSAIIKSLPHEDFPSIPKLKIKNEQNQEADSKYKTIKMNSKELVLGFKSVWYSASNSNIKPELGSVFIHGGENSLIFVSTDSFRLAEKKINTKIHNDFPQTLIPYKNAIEAVKLLEEYDGEIEIIFEKNQAAFVAGNIYMVSRLVDGSFPDYRQIIPKVFECEATVLKADLLNGIKVSNIFSGSLNQVKVKLNTKDKNIEIESKSSEVGEYKESIKAVISGSNLELSFNSKYIIESFQSIPDDSLSLRFGGSGKPLIISGSSDKSFVYMVMPMNK